MTPNLQMILSSFIIASLLAFAVSAQVASNPPYTLEQSVIASGGGTSSSAASGNTFSLTGAIGQAVAGTTSTNAPFSVSGGFFTNAAFAPTAASVTVSGRVKTSSGKGIRNILITLTTADGSTRTVLSGISGRYIFADVASGQTIILNATAKRYRFNQPTQVLNLTEEADGIDFIAQEQWFSTMPEF